MSAYVVDPRTIDLILTAASNYAVEDALKEAYPGQQRDGDTSDAEMRSVLGRYLLCMNVRSVQYRYNGESVATLPGYGYDYKDGTMYHPMPDYEYRPTRIGKSRSGAIFGEGHGMPLDEARRVLGALACFEYQSCELPEWSSTPAFRFVQAVRHSVCTQIQDGWEYTDADEPRLAFA